ncbi:hypothetical protein CKM354_000470500 [Cercospora kikuchii]|uniref:Uncharacterized protein n=1 Tax=Cercospora kikuchii TaxID=84275 RepID=A0A9P3FGE7_9PEZI|nr:uncharacterized protein CKM354_000470500 [Cercospora kikuchii]GIZ41400.1 hypothetical protein CKM354_000470500 [Cercospora kikuchii]
MITDHITVAQAAAVLNVAIVVVQVTYPLLISLVAVGIVKRRTNVATWSVFGRLINHSHWPFLLQTDSVNGKKVDKRIQGIAITSTLTTLLLAVAAVVTPLGLRSQLRAGEAQDIRFEYIRDTSALGMAAQSRVGYKPDRLCSDGLSYEPCPGNDDGVYMIRNASGRGLFTKPGRDDATLTTNIPENTTQVFSSADNDFGGTVANLFDIQYRSFINYNNQTEPERDERPRWVDAGQPRTQGKFQYYQQFLLENKTRAVEGLIVSTQTNLTGIGFRNHTLPPTSEYGYSWSEYILWLEPETACTNLNVTYEYTIPAPGYQADNNINQTIVDRGGFVDAPSTFTPPELNATQAAPKFLERSYVAAVGTNIFLGRYMNITKRTAEMGKRYRIEDYLDNGTFISGLQNNPEPNHIALSAFGKYDYATNRSNPGLPGPLSILSTYNFTENVSPDIVLLDDFINGYNSSYATNITRMGAKGGLILGTGTQIDDQGNPIPGSDALQLTPGGTWQQPIYSCVSGVSASIKLVDFQINGTANLDNLIIENVRDVEYGSEDDLPTWAIENTYRRISDIDPYWGLISSEAAKTANVSTVRQPKFRLPANAASVWGGTTIIDDAVAGIRAPLAALVDMFGKYTQVIPGAQDYTGASNYLLYLQWQRLLANGANPGKIVDLIWTDVMANNLVSARSTLSMTSDQGQIQRRDTSQSAAFALRPCAQYSIGISYDWRYAIPALMFACVYGALFVWSLVMFLTRNLSLGILRHMLNQTSAGRAITTERSQANNEIDVARTPVWARIKGDEAVRIGKDSLGGSYNGQHGGQGSGSQEYYPLEAKPGMNHEVERASQ